MAQYINFDDYGYVNNAVVPNNLNEEQFVAFTEHIKGSHMQFPYLKAPASDPAKWDDDNRVPVLDGGGINPVDPDYLPPYRTAPGLLDLHPQRMTKNMLVTVQEQFQVVTYILREDPRFITYGDIDEDNYRNYWSEVSRVSFQYEKEIWFAEEYDGSFPGYPDVGMPPYDYSTSTYPAGAEYLWETIEDTSRHRWYRYRVATYDTDGDPIISDWSPPIPISKTASLYVQIKNIFIRNGSKVGSSPTTGDRPATPMPIKLDGSPNNLPTGWDDSWVSTPTDEWLWISRAPIDIISDGLKIVRVYFSIILLSPFILKVLSLRGSSLFDC